MVDTDHDGWTLADGPWDGERMSALLDRQGHVGISGTVENQGGSYDRFEHVVLLTAPLDVLIDRCHLARRAPTGERPPSGPRSAPMSRTWIRC
jgi:hypothetical protein